MKKPHILTLYEIIACLEAIRDELNPEYIEHISPPLMIAVEIDGARARLGITQISYSGTVDIALDQHGTGKAKIKHELTATTE